MAVLFPGTHNAIMVMTVVMEAAKVVTIAWLSAKWRDVSWTFRLPLMALTFGVAGINAAGVYSQLVAAHVGPRDAAAAGLEARDADAAARIEVAQSRLADLDRRLVGVERNAEQIIWWLIAAMVLCCDPLSLVLVAAVSARHSRRGREARHD
jgi:hypothetical protein